MADLYSLFTKGLRWSYREYGLAGAVAFVIVVLLAYYLVTEKLEAVLDADAAAAESTDGAA